MKVDEMKLIKCNQAFSLIEMMMVIGTLSIIAAISLPSFNSAEHRTKTAANALMGDMQLTRMGAIKKNRDWAIVFDTNNNSYAIYDNTTDGNSNGNKWDDGGNEKVKTVLLAASAPGVTYKDGSGAGNEPVDCEIANPSNLRLITFNSHGTSDENGDIYMSMGESAYKISVYPTGMIKSSRWSGGTWK